MVCLLRELRRHGVRYQRWGVLLWCLCLGEGKLGMTSTSLCTTLARRELRGLEVVLACEGSCLVVKVGLSITVVAASTEAVPTVVIAPIASILCICAKCFVWSVVKPSTIISVPKTTVITPSRGISIPAVISIISTSASP